MDCPNCGEKNIKKVYRTIVDNKECEQKCDSCVRPVCVRSKDSDGEEK